MKIGIHPDYIHYSNFLKSIPSIFNNGGTVLYEGRNSVKLFSYEGMDFVVKKFKKPNIFQCITYSFFKKSKAERAFLFATKIREKGFETPHEIAYIEIKKNMLLTESYFICKECSYPSLYDTLTCDDFDKGLAKEVAIFIVNLHNNKIYHGDLNLSNILYQKREGKPTKFVLIDTNRSKFDGISSRRRKLINLIRITHNRELLKYIILEYTAQQGWNYRKSCNFVFLKLNGFEKKKAFRRKIKSFVLSVKS